MPRAFVGTDEGATFSIDLAPFVARESASSPEPSWRFEGAMHTFCKSTAASSGSTSSVSALMIGALCDGGGFALIISGTVKSGGSTRAEKIVVRLTDSLDAVSAPEAQPNVPLADDLRLLGWNPEVLVRALRHEVGQFVPTLPALRDVRRAAGVQRWTGMVSALPRWVPERLAPGDSMPSDVAVSSMDVLANAIRLKPTLADIGCADE